MTVEFTELVSADTMSVNQARELAPLRDDPEQMREVYEQAKEATGGKPTAAAIKKARAAA